MEVSSRAARPWLGRLARVAALGKDHVLIGRSGRHVAALVSPLLIGAVRALRPGGEEREVGLTAARQNFSELLNLAEHDRLRLVLTWRGEELALLLCWEDYAALTQWQRRPRRELLSLPRCGGWRPEFPRSVERESIPQRIVRCSPGSGGAYSPASGAAHGSGNASASRPGS